MSTIFSIHPKLCAFKLKYNLFPLIHLVQKYFTAVHRFINFWYCVYVFIYRVKLDYHTSKRLQPQHIERDKNSSPISAGINFFFFFILNASLCMICKQIIPEKMIHRAAALKCSWTIRHVMFSNKWLFVHQCEKKVWGIQTILMKNVHSLICNKI